ncbi:hypothetical protein Pan216_33530 [Planctomycetes bacterium Pan216]|uniref:DUF6268 domain-containing protein n=1 Tax=Kolteria novifilia TaxID=2527975 RepID=A0A518B691_9BACT|nr:hypothetical protein Pan216_33530 [Planctomycetes bacterium Pan216]
MRLSPRKAIYAFGLLVLGALWGSAQPRALAQGVTLGRPALGSVSVDTPPHLHQVTNSTAYKQQGLIDNSVVPALGIDSGTGNQATLLGDRPTLGGARPVGYFESLGVRTPTQHYAMQPPPAFDSPKPLQQLPAPNDYLPFIAYDELPDGCHLPFVVNYTFMGRAGVDDPSTNVKMSELELAYILPLHFGEKMRLTLTPFFDVWFLSGPGGPVIELPPQLYTVATDMQLDYNINEKWGLTLGITPGLWTDFYSISGADFRIPARALITHRFSERLMISAGLIYTDNFRNNLLPGFGFIWTPNDKWQVEAIYPRGRVLYHYTEAIDFYTYIERGGDTWNIRSFGVNEDFEYRDLRWLLGSEFSISKFRFFGEAGVTFSRLFRFDNQPQTDIKPAFIFQVGSRF